MWDPLISLFTNSWIKFEKGLFSDVRVFDKHAVSFYVEEVSLDANE